MRDCRPLRLMLVCGEPSGDQLGAQLMSAVRALESRVEFDGIGGPAMEGLGFRSLFPIDVTSVMGVDSILPRLLKILQRIRMASDHALSTRPDAIVCIDSPEFTHRIAQRVRRHDPSIATVNYVAPQVWAARQYRAKKMSRYFDLVLALLPFEASFLETHGLHARFVGHPVVERAARMTGGTALRQRLAIPATATLLVLLPGSRSGEVHSLLPVFRETVAAVRAVIPDLVCVMPTVSHVAAAVRARTQDWPTPLHILDDDVDKYAAFATADAALAASGTVTSELALAGVPMAVAYKLGWLSSAVARAIVRVPHVTIVNLLLGREAVPEFLQERCRADVIAPSLVRLFEDKGVREQQKRDLREAVHLLGFDDEPPSIRAARALLDFVRERSRVSAQRASIGR
ncbi:MAG: lipid-A-disaccharide synthase [Alphaproteobacteria bacterium]|nr:lipid-A-disaccharide synthase [Alphaproteobacteria bacterium]